MSLWIKVNLPDGRVWAVGGATYSRADVVIPIDQIGDLSDAEIGAYVRSMTEIAELAYAQNEADYVLHRTQLRNWDQTINIEECEVMFTRFEGRAQIIDQALEIIRARLAQRREQDAKRRRIGQHRSDIAGNYDRLFIAIGQRDGFCCAHCSAVADLTIDHIAALANDGTNDIDNLQLLCRSCNSRKGAR